MAATITALKVQKGNKERVNVYLDGEFAFGLDMMLAARLQVEQTLSEKEIEALLVQDQGQRAYHKALDFLSYRPRSQMEVEQYLRKKGISPQISHQVIERLQRAGLLDDAAFARFWVENRETFRPRGIQMLRYELRRKGVGDDLIEQALEGLDEAESAYRAAKGRANRYAGLEWATFRRRLGEFLRRRGFGYDAIHETLDRLWSELKQE
ncbi:MAG: RecX family transcriptional regulator [Anaerolineae bacterium]